MKPPDITLHLWHGLDSPEQWTVQTVAPALPYDVTHRSPDGLDALQALQRALLYTMGGVALREEADDD